MRRVAAQRAARPPDYWFVIGRHRRRPRRGCRRPRPPPRSGSARSGRRTPRCSPTAVVNAPLTCAAEPSAWNTVVVVVPTIWTRKKSAVDELLRCAKYDLKVSVVVPLAGIAIAGDWIEVVPPSTSLAPTLAPAVRAGHQVEAAAGRRADLQRAAAGRGLRGWRAATGRWSRCRCRPGSRSSPCRSRSRR